MKHLSTGCVHNKCCNNINNISNQKQKDVKHKKCTHQIHACQGKVLFTALTLLTTFFLFKLLQKAQKEKHTTTCSVARKHCLNAHLFLLSLSIYNIIEQKRLEIKKEVPKKVT